MFNFQGSELIIILLLALVVLGPEKLPEAMRRLGRFYADLKKMSTGFQEEFRAAVDEPRREIRDTANTLRDSLDFRKLQDGQRPEKPKSAEMAPADPAAVPTHDVPFQVVPVQAEEPSPLERRSGDTDAPSDAPAPFSSSQAISAAAPPPADDRGDDEPGGDHEPGHRAVEPPVRLAPQVAVDDEHGLREARPAASTTSAPGIDEAGIDEAGMDEDGAA